MGRKISKHYTTKEQRRTLADRMKNPDDELKLVIVREYVAYRLRCAVPSYALYRQADEGHNLNAAIARVNRVYKDKKGGLIVDYLGIASDLKKALSFYSDSGGKGDPAVAQGKSCATYAGKTRSGLARCFMVCLWGIFSMPTSAGNFLLSLPLKNTFLAWTTEKRDYWWVTALSQVYSIAIPHEQEWHQGWSLVFPSSQVEAG